MGGTYVNHPLVPRETVGLQYDSDTHASMPGLQVGVSPSIALAYVVWRSLWRLGTSWDTLAGLFLILPLI